MTVIAIDHSGNQTQASFTIERISVPRIVSVSPVSGTVSTTDTITISGVVDTVLPASDFVLRINDSQVFTTSTEQSNLYHFDFQNVALDIGPNVFQFDLTSEFGGDERTITLNYTPIGSELIPVPTISQSNPSTGASINQPSFRFGVQAESFAGPLSLTVNGNELLSGSEGLSFYSTSELIDFAGNDQVMVNVIATDGLGRQTQRQYVFFNDESGPSFAFEEGLTPGVDVIMVDTSVVTISGFVSDANLANMQVNDQPVALAPGGDEDTYRFQVKVGAGSEQPSLASFVAYDRSGNKTVADFFLLNTSSSSISALLPPNNSEFVSQDNQLIRLQVAARLSNAQSDATPVAYLQSAPQNAIVLALNNSLASGYLDLPAEASEQTIVFELRDTQGTRITQDSIDVTVTPAQEVAVEVVRLEPANNQEFIEPNAPIEVYFNQEVDLTQLQINVTETLHGKSYVNNDPLGEDFIRSQGHILTDINRDRAPVEGQVSLIPGDAGAVFAPNTNYGYNAELFVDVVYNGESLSRTRFQVRELPTFINGAITDQFGQPLKGITVTIPELNRETITNGDGGFAFGYQEAADRVIDGGSYTLLVNDGFRNRNFGNINTSISVQRNRVNSLERFKLQELDSRIFFANFSSDTNNVLIGGDLEIDMSDPQSRAIFPNSRISGPVHVQFLPQEHLGVQGYRYATANWLYGVQPKGIEIEGDVSLKLKVPMLRGGREYLDPEVFRYVVLLGYSRQGQVVEPIGVGQLTNNAVESRGKVNLSSLDFIGYAQVFPSLAPDLERYANGDISLPQLKAALQAQFQRNIDAQSGN